jgi:ABC-type branched-subunit amino acid transport system substrate-binding protein
MAERAWRWVWLLLLAGSAAAWAEPGVTDKAIVLGQSAAFTGPAAQLGREVNLGARAYFQYINSQGGVNGRRIDLHSLDDGYEATKAAANTIDFIEKDQVFALFGYVGTPTSNAAAPIFTEAHVPFLAPYSGALSLREPLNRYIFNLRATYGDETERIVEQLTTTGNKNIGVFYQNDAYGKGGLDGVTKALARRGLNPSVTATVERNSTDVTAASQALMKGNPGAIVQISAYASCAALIKRMRELGYTGQFVNVSFVGSKALAEELGPQGQGVMITQVVPFPFSEVTPLQREYQQVLKKAGVPEPSFGSMEGYLAAKLFVVVLRRLGPNVTRERLIEGYESLHEYDLGGFIISYSPTDHSGSKFVEITMIGANGSFVR